MKKVATKRKTSGARALAASINATLKTDAVVLGSDARFIIERVPTGSLTIDRITGGGFPRGRHVEMYGDYLAGKSLILYLTMALAQERGEVCALIDSEGVFEADWFRRLGGDPGDLVLHEPRTAEEMIEVLMLFASSEAPADIVGVDSVASLLPQEELAKRPTDGEDRTAARARMMSRALRRITAVNDKTLFIWTNQIIDSIGGYGVSTPGGRALKFYASIRVEMRKRDKKKVPRKRARQAKLVDVDTTVGQWVIVRAEKQKTARPEMESMFLFDYDERRIDADMEIITLGLEDGLIERSGNTFHYEAGDGLLWSGMESKFRRILRDEEEVREELMWAISENTRVLALGEEEIDNGA